MEVSAFMTEQLKAQMEEQRAHDKAQHVEVVQLLRERDAQARAEKLELEAKLEQAQREVEQLRAQVAARAQPAVEVIDDEQLSTLQSRLQSLHEAKLLTDDELFALEDAIVDCVEVLPTAIASVSEVEKVKKMLWVASRVASDSTLARQLRRKFV
jgi:uncharacterized protein (DUF1697 family)